MPAPLPSTGVLTVTEGQDVFAGSGVDTAFGILSGSGRDDIFAGASIAVMGSAAPTEGHDTAALAGWCIVAALAGTEQHDTLAAAGGFGTAGSAAATGSSDSQTSAGGFGTAGSAAVTAGNDNAALAGLETFPSYLSGTGGADVFAGAGTRSSSAAIAPTEGHDVRAAAGSLAFAGALAPTEGHDTFAGFSFECRATMAATERGDVLLGAETGLGYHISSNTGTADPINYNVPIATTGLLTWTPSPLAYPGIWRFGVRAYDTFTGLEEENLDCAITIILDAMGVDITNRPKAPTALRAFPRSGGTIRVEWGYNAINPQPVPTGFHVYIGTGGSPSYGSSAATVSFGAAIGGAFMADLTGLTNGTVYTIGVRAYNATAEEPNTVTVNCTADSTGPTAVVSLMATAI